MMRAGCLCMLLAGSMAAAIVPVQKPDPIFLEAGTEITVRLAEAVDSATSYTTRTYRATVTSPVVVDDRTLLPAGGDCTITITHAQEAGRFKGRTSLTLQLTSLVFKGRKYDLHSEDVVEDAGSRGKATVRTAGLGAVIGAVLGGVTAGEAGAAGGAAAGAGAGSLVSVLTPKGKVFLPVETQLVFTLDDSVVLEPIH